MTKIGGRTGARLGEWFKHCEVFKYTSTCTATQHTIDGRCDMIEIELQAGGGGGAGGLANGRAGAGAGSGSYAQGIFHPFEIPGGQLFFSTIGAGATAGSATGGVGGDGQDISVSVATGFWMNTDAANGAPANSATTPFSTPPSAGANNPVVLGGGAQINIPGCNGTPGLFTAVGQIQIGGNGADSWFGRGGVGGNAAAGNTGAGYGFGGAGGANGNVGGVGGEALIVIREYRH